MKELKKGRENVKNSRLETRKTGQRKKKEKKGCNNTYISFVKKTNSK
jgi:hypothetical protein